MSSEEFSQEAGSGKSGSSGSSKKQRRNRRRSVKRRKSSGSGSASEQSGKSQSKRQSEKQRVNERARSQRRRRRSRSKRRRKTNSGNNQTTLKIDYVAPESVFIYTHIARMDLRDSGYEYRPDHFSHTGRQLDDFRIDLSPIMGTILDVEEGSRGFLKEFAWDDDLDEETIFEPEAEPDDDAAAEDHQSDNSSG
jgi:hypothetical protein